MESNAWAMTESAKTDGYWGKQKQKQHMNLTESVSTLLSH